MAYLRQDGVYHFKNYASRHCYHFQENGQVCGFGLGQLKLEDIRARLRDKDYVCGKYTLEGDRISIQFDGGPSIRGRVETNRLLLQIHWDDSNDSIESREYDFFVIPQDPADAAKAEKVEPANELPSAPPQTGRLTEPKIKAAESHDLPVSPGKTKLLGEISGSTPDET
jgi:hypothetical protein